MTPILGFLKQNKPPQPNSITHQFQSISCQVLLQDHREASRPPRGSRFAFFPDEMTSDEAAGDEARRASIHLVQALGRDEEVG